MLLVRRSKFLAGRAGLLWNEDTLAEQGLTFTAFGASEPDGDPPRVAVALAAMLDGQPAALGICRYQADRAPTLGTGPDGIDPAAFIPKQWDAWGDPFDWALKVVRALEQNNAYQGRFVETWESGGTPVYHFGAYTDDPDVDEAGHRLFKVHLFVIPFTGDDDLPQALALLPSFPDADDEAGVIYYDPKVEAKPTRGLYPASFQLAQRNSPAQ